MNLSEIFKDKTLRQKVRTKLLSDALLGKKLSVEELVGFATKAEDVDKATCIEAMEQSAKKQRGLVTEKCLKFLIKALSDEAPRVKWEAARAIGAVAPEFPAKLKPAVKQLLVNSEDKGTVVRWATAYALGEILKLNTGLNKELLPAVEAICKREDDNGVKKKYLDAIKKVKAKKAS